MNFYYESYDKFESVNISLFKLTTLMIGIVDAKIFTTNRALFRGLIFIKNIGLAIFPFKKD